MSSTDHVMMQKLLADHLRFCQRMYVLQTLVPYTGITLLAGLVAYSVGQIGHEGCQMLLKVCLVPEQMLNGMLAYIQYDYRFSMLQNVVKAINHEMAPNAWQMHWHMQVLAFVMSFISLTMLYQLSHIQEFGLFGFHVKRSDNQTYLQQLPLKLEQAPAPPVLRQTHSYPPRRLRHYHQHTSGMLKPPVMVD